MSLKLKLLDGRSGTNDDFGQATGDIFNPFAVSEATGDENMPNDGEFRKPKPKGVRQPNG